MKLRRFAARGSAVVGTLSAATVLLLWVASTAAADRLVAGGTALEGSVKSISPAGVEFQPGFAKGPMLVPWENVEDLTTDGKFSVLHGERGETQAPIRGYHDGQLTVGETSIDPKTIVSATAFEGEAPGFADRVRSNLRYWHGGADLGFNMQQSTTDNLGVAFALHALRSKDPTRLILGFGYRYGTEDRAGSPKSRTQDSVSGAVRGEYDFTKRIYGYGSTDALYDAVQSLSLRAVPKAGAGYVLWQREPKEGVRDFLQAEVGGGYVYEKYFGGADSGYATLALGASAAYLLPRGMTLNWRFDYLPAVDDFTDYVIRNDAGLTVPLVAPVSAKLSITDMYDSTPSAGSDKNSLYLTSGLSLGW